MAVGIFDSGLGGLTVLDAVSKALPDVPFVYYGDNAHAPYGVRDADDIYNLTTAALERMSTATVMLWSLARRLTGCDAMAQRSPLVPPE